MRSRLACLSLLVCGLAWVANAQQQMSLSFSSSSDGKTTVHQVDGSGESWSMQQALSGLDGHPMDAARRFLELDDTSATAIDALDAEYDAALAAEIAAIKARMQTAYVARVTQVLPEASREPFAKLMSIIEQHRAAMLAADTAYRNELAEAKLPADIQLSGMRTDQVAYRVPGLTEDEREAVKQVAHDARDRNRGKVSEAMKAAGVQRPGRGDREGWMTYMQKRNEISESIQSEEKDRTLIEIGAALNPESAETFDILISAVENHKAAKQTADAQLAAELNVLIGKERADEALKDTGQRDWMQMFRNWRR